MKELLLLSSLGILSLIAEILSVRKLIYPLVMIGLMLNIGFCVKDYGNNEHIYGMMMLDNVPLAFTALFSFIAILWFTMARNYFTDETNMSDHFSLVLFSMVGVFILTSYTHLVMLFLGIEILSIPVYVLAGSNKKSLYSNEAAFKYFLLGAFASGFLLLGITFVYGGIGSFNIVQIAASAYMPSGISHQLMVVGLLLILFAMAFKMSAVPFHFWAPDVYTGSPTVITAYMATIVKIGAIAGFFRLFSLVLPSYRFFTEVLLLIGVLSIIVGNIIAATQSNVKRLLAYSSIGHAGFIILGITLVGSQTSYITWAYVTLYYLLAYTLANIAAFWVLLIVSNQENTDDIHIFNGLAKRSPVLAGTMAIALLSMAGIPPLSGFFAKYFILINVIDNGKILVAVIAILASLIGVYYYFKIIIAMFSGSDEYAPPIQISGFNKMVLILICLLIVIIGILPDYFFRLIFK
ncbi:MAG: NADH-quinone oxidoreductase subunit [Bacteroidota bacterium]|nr:NADH-quinone oxidoreductase subunit [Bacteroidota bacterium]